MNYRKKIRQTELYAELGMATLKSMFTQKSLEDKLAKTKSELGIF